MKQIVVKAVVTWSSYHPTVEALGYRRCLSIPTGPTTRVLLDEPESHTNDTKKSIGGKSILTTDQSELNKK